MISILNSSARSKNSQFVESGRERGEHNVEWLERHVRDAGDAVCIALVGGVTQDAFRVRVAQSHLRHDLTPSYWSHVMLLGRARKKASGLPVHEISLNPRDGFGFPPPTNAVQGGTFKRYRSEEEYPNIALLILPKSVTRKEVSVALEKFQRQRAVLDAVELLLRWLAFVWGAGAAGNPLLENVGYPSAAMLEIVIGAAGFDLTPGLESRSSCPEAIWQSANWWHEYYRSDTLAEGLESEGDSALNGYWCVEHRLGEL